MPFLLLGNNDVTSSLKLITLTQGDSDKTP